MIEKDGKHFNCCESVLMEIDEKHSLPGFGPVIMRIASNFGGGVGGWGSVCGAVAGVPMAFGLIWGTDGEESLEEFEEKRVTLREITQDFMKSFEDEFGSVNCMILLGVDRRTEEGKARYQELRDQGAFKCDEYVSWSVKRALEMLSENSF